MSNLFLISRPFERAANSLVNAMDEFARNGIGHDVERFGRSVEQFQSSVDKLTKVLGMQAENDQRKVLGQSMAYTESDFQSI